MAKLTDAEKHAAKVAKIAYRLRALSPGKQINDVARVFQKVVRMRSADDDGMCQCVTCGKRYRWNDRNINAGHFVSRKSKSTVFMFINCHPQCVHCNDHLGGNPAEYERFMIDKYGQEKVDELKVLGREVLKWSPEDLAQKKVIFLEMMRNAAKNLQ